MIPFLKSVAKTYFEKTNIENQFFIFPNRRSLMFFRKYLSQVIAGNSSKAFFAPGMMTINDFFYKLNDIFPTDRLNLLLNLYEVYKNHNTKAESLDEFIFWGDVILGDFNDVDKYLVDAKQLFANIEDLKNIRDNYSYLSENQRRAIETFISHFNDVDGRLTVDIGSDNPDVKSKFLYIWNLLYPIYVDYNKLLTTKNMAYEGMVYRKIVDSFKEKSIKEILKAIFPNSDNYVFVGLNALNECEKSLLRKMRNEGIAEFVWDYFTPLIKDRDNKSSFFLSDNVKEFPPKYELCADLDPNYLPEINVLNIASSIGQAKQIPMILEKLDVKETNTAIVLPDENLLVPVLKTIPPEIEDINVTMGYPLANSSFYILIKEVLSLQLNIKKQGSINSFYHKQLYSLLSNNIFKLHLKEDYDKVLDIIKKDARVYIPENEFKDFLSLNGILRSVVDKKSRTNENINSFINYLLEVTSLFAESIKDEPDLALESEYAKEYYTTLVQLSALKLEVLPSTFIRLLDQLIVGQIIPFKGEPLKGLQIMGPLETRALDFENIIILSSNEGVFPRKSFSSSFVPPELRRAFALPTYEYQDAVWAYYFYRMIQRTKKLWLVYDSRTEGLSSGEESRYIKQLRYHFQLPVNEYVIQNNIRSFETNDVIAKTQDDIAVIKKILYSASSLNAYLDCSMKFYYSKIKKLKAEDQVSESLDAGMIGNVFHKTMQQLYSDTPSHHISKLYLDELIKDKKRIRTIIDENIFEQIKSKEIVGRNIVIQEVIYTYIIKALKIDREKLDENGVDFFTVLGLEEKMLGDFDGYKFIGYIDRFDSFLDGQLRIVDYKTGKVLPNDVMINEKNAESIAEGIFNSTKGQRAKIALQFYIYDRLVRQSDKLPENLASKLSKTLIEKLKGKTIINSVYSTAAMFRENPLDLELNEAFYDKMSEEMRKMFEELTDVNIPFKKANEADKKCEWCDFKIICGR